MIWQYWETVGDGKPAFIDGLHAIARKNAETEIVLVTPETLGQFIPYIPSEIFKIAQIAHKADMIRAMLVMRHGGMWLELRRDCAMEIGLDFRLIRYLRLRLLQ